MNENMLARLMAQMGDDDRTPAVSHVGQIARLREFKERLDAGNPFAVGDLVTPRPDAPIKGVGAPHLVVETTHPGCVVTRFDGDPGAPSYGAKIDMRVVHLSGPHLVMHWVESVDFELYVAEVHEKQDRERA